MKIAQNVAYYRAARLDHEIDLSASNSMRLKAYAIAFMVLIPVIFDVYTSSGIPLPKFIPCFTGIVVMLFLLLLDLYFQSQRHIAEKEKYELYEILEKPLPETKHKRNLTIPYYIIVVCVMFWMI